MAIVIRPYREPDRPVVRELTVSAFEGVSIDHNIDLRLGPIAGRDWRWRKSRRRRPRHRPDGSDAGGRRGRTDGRGGRLRHHAMRHRDADRLDP